MATEEDRPYLIEYAKMHLSDMVPYDDPHYEEKLQAMAEAYAESEINPDPEFERFCEQCDEDVRKELNKKITTLRHDIAMEADPFIVSLLEQELENTIEELKRY